MNAQKNKRKLDRKKYKTVKKVEIINQDLNLVTSNFQLERLNYNQTTDFSNNQNSFDNVNSMESS